MCWFVCFIYVNAIVDVFVVVHLNYNSIDGIDGNVCSNENDTDTSQTQTAAYYQYHPTVFPACTR